MGTKKRGPAGIEHVHRHVVAIGPDAEMGIIEKVGAEVKAIAIVSAGGTRGRGDGDAFVGRDPRRAGKLADKPAIGDLIVKDDRIAKTKLTIASGSIRDAGAVSDGWVGSGGGVWSAIAPF